MQWPVLIAGFTLGTIGSLHCVGMCGPLALALPVQHFSKTKKLFAISIYQMGRVFTYTVLGLILGLLGRRVYLAGFQRWFSILLGVLVVIMAIQYWGFGNSLHPNFFNRLYRQVQKAIMYFLRSDKIISYFMLGSANGLLPCGMVYVAIAGALTSSSTTGSALFMASFGAGTLPAMIAIGYLGQFIKLSVRNSFKKLVPVFAAVIGLILILRGLNLGIPFISPVLQHAAGQSIICH